MSAGHSHAHDHGSSSRGRLAIALGVTVAILVAEVAGALVTGSLALLVDAAHMLTDTLGLAVALVAAKLMLRPPSPRRTWGWQRAEVLAAGAQAAILLAVGAYALVEGGQRLVEPPVVAPGGMALVGALGLAGNLVSMAVLAGGRGENLNMRAAFLEVVNDALGSVAVLAAAGVIVLTGWARADAVAGLLVAALIVPRSVVLLRESGSILLESTPRGLDLGDVRDHLLGVPHVQAVHDLHASTVATGLPVLTAHVVLDDECFSDGHCLEILHDLQDCLTSHFPVRIEHTTIQLESAAHAGHEPERHA